jgi:hypothetical protein
VPAPSDFPGAVIDAFPLEDMVPVKGHEQTKGDAAIRQPGFGQYRKGLSRAIRVAAAVALITELIVALKPVSPVVAIAANAVAFTAQRTPDKYRSGSLN